MITTEIFLILKLFTENNVSWWWVVFFVITDWVMWASLRSIFGGTNET